LKERFKGKEKDVDVNYTGEDRIDRINKLIEEGNLEEARKEIFSKGALEMLENGKAMF
jgi:hypothetical protein